MPRTPAFETPDWFMAQVYPLFWPILFWNLTRFDARCDAIRAQYGRGAMVVYRVHWWSWIEIGDIWQADKVRPDWQVKAEAVVARLLLPVMVAGPAEDAPVWGQVVLGFSPIGLPVPALQDSS